MTTTMLAKRISCLPVDVCYCQNGVMSSKPPKAGDYVLINKRPRLDDIFAAVALVQNGHCHSELLVKTYDSDIATVYACPGTERWRQLLEWGTQVMKHLPPPSSECRGE